MCYLPSYENYVINVDNSLIERKYELESESLKEEIDIKGMELDEILEVLKKKQITIKETAEDPKSFSSTDEL